MSVLSAYLIGINALGFLVALIACKRATEESHAVSDVLLSVMSILGGTVGIALALLAFYRKAEKATMMPRVCVACMIVIQAVVVLVMRGHIAQHITLNFFEFVSGKPILLIYLILVDLLTIIAFAVDKHAALKSNRRVKIVTLLVLAYCGGTVGALLGMYLFRHKTNKNYFYLGIPLMLIMQVIVLWYAMNWAW
ncbi:DUF1294 domain-containing protein [Alloscardovia omnicolens]|uniref:DUF1294 domain-containing protein n=1 Tax=Alloscardovia omnicolens TaxID=419015 RepID=UPI003A739FA4